MKVWVLVKGKKVEAKGIPCGDGDTIEVREGPAKGFHPKRGVKWGRLDGRQSTYASRYDLAGMLGIPDDPVDGFAISRHDPKKADK